MLRADMGEMKNIYSCLISQLFGILCELSAKSARYVGVGQYGDTQRVRDAFQVSFD